MLGWYEIALQQLEIDLRVDSRLNGMTFLEDFVLKKRDIIFPDIEFSDVDYFVSDQFDSFENWLREKKLTWLTIKANGKWLLNNNPIKEDEDIDQASNFELGLTKSEQQLLDMGRYNINKSLVTAYKNLYSRLITTNNFDEETYECALALAKCAELDSEISTTMLIKYWSDALEAAQKIGSHINISDCHENIAKTYQKHYEHNKAGDSYKKAFTVLGTEEYKEKLQLARYSRVQYELAGSHVEASEMFILEKDLEAYKERGLKKIALKIYKATSEYGENPALVLKVAFKVLILSIVFNLLLGTNNFKSIVCIIKDGDMYTLLDAIGNSIYFSFVTFTTLGYGEITPIGFLGKMVTSVLAILGLTLTSLFMITVVRKYSRS